MRTSVLAVAGAILVSMTATAASSFLIVGTIPYEGWTWCGTDIGFHVVYDATNGDRVSDGIQPSSLGHADLAHWTKDGLGGVAWKNVNWQGASAGDWALQDAAYSDGTWLLLYKLSWGSNERSWFVQWIDSDGTAGELEPLFLPALATDSRYIGIFTSDIDIRLLPQL